MWKGQWIRIETKCTNSQRKKSLNEVSETESRNVQRHHSSQRTASALQMCGPLGVLLMKMKPAPPRA